MRRPFVHSTLSSIEADGQVDLRVDLRDLSDRHKIKVLAAAAMVMAIMLAAAIVEHLMGRVLICTSGRIHFWVGSISSSQLSQQITDWYSFSHIIHGFTFYGIFYAIGRRWNWSIPARLLFSTLLEASWEILENSPVIIDRYRQTAATGYIGDSILNSMSDITCCLLGFGLARVLPVRVIILLILTMEIGVGYAIHDNLLLNIVMLIHPFSGIKHWQMNVG